MELKYTVAKNIARLRKQHGLTQLQLAESLSYSDKAVSKWESGASLPDVTVLKEMAELFGVTVDSLLSENTEIVYVKPHKKHFYAIIMSLSVMLVWLVATALFVFLTISNIKGMLWLSFIWAIPVSFIVLIVLNSIWGNRRNNYIFISALMWTLLGAIYLTLITRNLWLLFVIGVPGETIICLWAGMNKNAKNKDNTK